MKEAEKMKLKEKLLKKKQEKQLEKEQLSEEEKDRQDEELEEEELKQEEPVEENKKEVEDYINNLGHTGVYRYNLLGALDKLNKNIEIQNQTLKTIGQILITSSETLNKTLEKLG